MNTTKVGVIIDAFVTSCTNAGLTVVDGPPVTDPNIGQDVLYVGWRGTDGDGVTTAQDWAGLGNRARDENGSLFCYFEATRGDTTMKPTRDAALAGVATVETVLRADPQLGTLTGPDRVMFGGADSHIPLQTSAGSRWGVAFHLDFFTRL